MATSVNNHKSQPDRFSNDKGSDHTSTTNGKKYSFALVQGEFIARPFFGALHSADTAAHGGETNHDGDGHRVPDDDEVEVGCYVHYTSLS